ncbi:hypothetical protein DV738_g260, partial [Chaetothyriales sp. CBS 135597]
MAGRRSKTRARIHPIIHSVKDKEHEQTSKKYEYEQLHDKNEFRILSLRPGAGDDQIECILQTFCFNDCPLYTAISHRWAAPGAEEDNATILIDSQEMKVQPTEHELLRSLRQRDEVRRLWIDTICINQADEREKALQIPTMREIYSQASYSIAWLAGSTLKSHINVLHVARCYGRAKRAGEARPVACEPCKNLCSSIIEMARAFSQLFEHEYWNRRWIIQEVVLANTVEVQCGVEITPLSNLIEFVQDALEGKTFYPWEVKPPLRWRWEKVQHTLPQRLHRDRLIRHSNSDMQSSSLRDLLFRYRASACSEPCDKIFALLSLSPTAVENLKVDYQMRLADLVTTVVQFCYNFEHLPGEEVLQLGYLLMTELGVDLRSYVSQPANGSLNVDVDNNNRQHKPVNIFQGIIIKAFDLGNVTSGIPVGEESIISELRGKARGLIQFSPILLKRCNTTTTFALNVPNLEFLGTTEDAVAAKDFWAFTSWESSTCAEEYVGAERRSVTDKVKTVGIASVKILPGDVLWYFKGSDIVLIARKAKPLKGSGPGDMMIVGRAYLGHIPEGINTEDAEEKQRYAEQLPTVSFELTLDLFVRMAMWTSYYSEDRRGASNQRKRGFDQD